MAVVAPGHHVEHRADDHQAQAEHGDTAAAVQIAEHAGGEDGRTERDREGVGDPLQVGSVCAGRSGDRAERTVGGAERQVGDQHRQAGKADRGG
jgi:hypothetical protein